MLDDAGTAWGAIGAGAGAALKPARHLLRLSPCCPCRFVVAAKTITQQHIHVPMSHHRFRLPMHECGSKSASGKAAPMLEEPPRALLRSEVPGDCPLGGPITGLAAALGFPHAFAGGAGAAFSALAYLGGCTTGPIPSELDIWGCLGEGPCTWTQCGPLMPALRVVFGHLHCCGVTLGSLLRSLRAAQVWTDVTCISWVVEREVSAAAQLDIFCGALTAGSAIDMSACRTR